MGARNLGFPALSFPDQVSDYGVVQTSGLVSPPHSSAWLNTHPTGGKMSVRFEKFETVAPRIFREESVRARQGIVVHRRHGVGNQRLAELGEVANRERWMRLLRRSKLRFHADVYLLLAAREPAPASSAQRFRLFNFPQAQQPAVKRARRILASLRRR